MSVVLLAIGLACVVAAIVGTRFTAFGMKTPILESKARQIGLAGIGAVALVAGVMMRSPPGSHTSSNANTLARERSKAPGSATNTPWSNEIGTLFADQHRCANLGRTDDAELAELELRFMLKDSLWVRGYSPKTQDNMSLRELETVSRDSGLAVGQRGSDQRCK
jgi:hypothetical protein